MDNMEQKNEYMKYTKEEQKTEQEMEYGTEYGTEYRTEHRPEPEKRSSGYKRGFLAGIATMLVIVIIVSAVGSMVLTRHGYVLTTFRLDKSMTGNVLSEPVENKIAEVISALSRYYYEDLDQAELSTGLYRGLVDSLGDKYTNYYTPEEYAAYMNSTNGTYFGIGAVLSQDVNTMQISISRVYDGSPAQEAGLKEGDIFISAGGVAAANMGVSEFVNYVKGEEGTKVDLVMERDGEEMTFVVERRKVEIPTVNHQMLDGVGYIEILEFDGVTAKQFKKALAELKSAGMKALIVDLRSNPGGMIASVTEILDEILPEGLLVYTQEKSGAKKEYFSDSKELGMPLAVLINEDSASASEIFAGAIKDYDYGTLIGTTTFGKGIVQALLPLSDGSALKVTTAKYYTPSGNYIHGVGIDPDIELKYEFLGEETETYDIMKDNQVLKALEVLTNE